MKKITLLSDTHSFIDEKALKYCTNSDEIWHAGDIGNKEVIEKLEKITLVRAVYGNIDSAELRLEYPLHNRFLCEEVDVWITHIGGYPNKYNPSIREELEKNPPKIFICGHSHILKVMFDKKLNLLHLNPGAIGIYGFHQVRTMLQFEIDGKEIKNMQVVELAKN